MRPSDIYALVNLAIIGSDNGWSHVRCQAIIGANTGLLPISEILELKDNNFHSKMNLKMSPIFCVVATALGQ